LAADQLLDSQQSYCQTSKHSAYQAFGSTETVIVGLLFDILLMLNAGNIDARALLGLFCSAAVDTVDHTILPQRLQASFGLLPDLSEWHQPTQFATLVST